MFVFEGCDIIDACGPLDVFAFANYWFHMSGRLATPAYSLSIISEQAGPVQTFSGIRVMADHAIGENDEGIDTLLVAGGPNVEPARRNPAVMVWIKAMADRVRRIGSICTGAFLLAESGLLDGRRATTHWGYCQRLAEEFPNVAVEPDRIFVRDGNVYCSGGVTAGIDLALYLVEEDWGYEAATATARGMVTFPCRPGGQSQFRSFLLGENRASRNFRELQEWINANPQADLSVEALAQRMSMSPRHFSRLFDQEVGMPPAKFVETARLSSAFFLLEQTLLPMDIIAKRCGFGSAENMRRSFQRHLKVSPQDYRTRFRSPGHGSKAANESRLYN
jgi:transcriptional regulator GlxA family with amidase domain